MNPLEFLDRPIAFHRCFVELTRSITAALMLSQAVYWQRQVPEDQDGWWYKDQAEWTEKTGMTRYEQETAREKLRNLGVLEEARRGIPARLWYRVNEDALTRLLEALSGSKPEGLSPSGA